MKLKNLLGAVALGTMLFAPAAMAADGRYEAALEQMFQMTYGRELAEPSTIEEIVQEFREGASQKASAQNCPALDTTVDTFADKQFRKAVTQYFQSPALKDHIKDAMRKHYRQEDLEAFLSFAATPAGKAYLDRSNAANAEVKRALQANTELMMEAPEMKAMLGELMVELLPVMMKCQKS